jgi:hypothetical protein
VGNYSIFIKIQVDLHYKIWKARVTTIMKKKKKILIGQKCSPK